MRRILIIDDDTYMCNLLAEYLKQRGYSTKGAFNGLDGKKLIKRMISMWCYAIIACLILMVKKFWSILSQ
jgi:DNA-binding response OmpR family regulator